MLSITSELGRTEEFFSEFIYPVWPLWLAGAIIIAGIAGYVAYRRGAYEWALRHRFITGAAIAVILMVSAPVAYYTISPLFERNTVCEASPIPGAGSGSEKCEGVAVAATAEPTGAPTNQPQPTATPAPAPDATSEPTPDATEAPAETPFVAHTVRQGTWQSADDFHFAIGDALLIETAPGQYTLRVENFSVRNGPDVFVLLSPSGNYQEGALNLGSLKGTDGAFNYEVPAGTDVSAYTHAIIWCKQFDVLFGSAELV